MPIKTMKELCMRFNAMHKYHVADFCSYESAVGYYVVYITDETFNLSSRYVFETCKDFEDWMNGVVLD